MSYSKNTFRKTESVHLGNTTNTTRFLENEVAVSVSGESLSSQKTSPTQTTEKTYEDVLKLLQQNNLYVSTSDRPYYDLDPQVMRDTSQEGSVLSIDAKQTIDYNPVKEIEKDVGDLNNVAIERSSEQKGDRVKQDNVKSKRSMLEYVIDANQRVLYGNEKYKERGGNGVTEDEAALWGEEGNTEETKEATPSKNKTNGSPFVVIEEDRDGNSALKEHGDYSNNDIIRIEILRSVSPFTFGTRQEFDPVEPRGSQTPMRFYNKNPGRSLGFSADFHQQEYPLEPLLSIAEKAQYLCRPYKHSDYALIPKLVRVTIPGRVFRGYLQNADITYQGDDYRAWALDAYKPTESKVNHSLSYLEKTNKNNSFYEYPIEENQTNRIRNDVPVPVNGINDVIDYGLGEISIRFDLLITEEIKLTSYESDSEKKAREEEKEREAKRKEIQDALEKAKEFLKEHPEFEEYSPEDLVIVDAITGEYIGLRFDDDGNILELDGNDFTKVTYAEFMNKGRVNNETSNSATSLSNALQKLPTVAQNEATEENMFAYLVAENKKLYPAKDVEEIEAELHARYDGNPDLLSESYVALVLKKLNNGDSLSKFQAIFLGDSYSLNVSTVSYGNKAGTSKLLGRELEISEPIRSILDNQLNTIDDINKFLIDFHVDASELQLSFNCKYTYFYYSGTPNLEKPLFYKNKELEKEVYLWDYIYTSYTSPLNEVGVYANNDEFEDAWLDLQTMEDKEIITSNQRNVLETYYKSNRITMEKLYDDHCLGLQSLIKDDSGALKAISNAFSVIQVYFYEAYILLRGKCKDEINNDVVDLLPESIKKIVSNRDILVFPKEKYRNNQILLQNVLKDSTILNFKGGVKIENYEYFYHIYSYYTIK